MATPVAELSDGNNLVMLKSARTIGITASAETERGKGLSTVRFVMTGEEAKGEEPFATLTKWHEKGHMLALSVDHEIKLEGCSLRECTWTRPAANFMCKSTHKNHRQNSGGFSHAKPKPR